MTSLHEVEVLQLHRPHPRSAIGIDVDFHAEFAAAVVDELHIAHGGRTLGMLVPQPSRAAVLRQADTDAESDIVCSHQREASLA